MRRRWAVEIRPGGGNPQARAVWHHEDQLKCAAVGGGAENFECLPVEGMAWAANGHPLRAAVTVLVVGIVSYSPSTRFPMPSSWPWWPSALSTARFWV